MELSELREKHKAMKQTKKDTQEKAKLEKEIKDMEIENSSTRKFFKGVGKVVRFVKKELK